MEKGITQKLIKELCEINNITVTGLEKKLGFSNRSLSGDSAIRSDRLLEVAKYFDVSMEYLMGVNDDPAPVIKEDANALRLASKEGQQGSLVIAIEECSELQKAITKYLRYHEKVSENELSRLKENTAEEMADVLIAMKMAQHSMDINSEDITKWYEAKMQRNMGRK